MFGNRQSTPFHKPLLINSKTCLPMKKFEPNINRTLFCERIIEIQGQEGNSGFVTRTIDNKLKESNELSFFENFMKICFDYKVGFYGVEREDEVEKYAVIITFNNYDSLEMKYADKQLDISVKLAENIYSQLAIMIKNEDYLRNLKE